MDKYDEHGFYTREWAEQNIAGFSEMDPCCQQEILLFPDVPVPCISKEIHIPEPELPEWIVIGPPKLGEIIPTVGYFGGHSEEPTSVDTGDAFWFMAVVLVLMAVLRFFGRDKSE